MGRAHRLSTPGSTVESHFADATPALRDARKFDNYVLHAGAIQGGSTPGFAVLPVGKAYFPFPDDPASNRIGTWEEFRYRDGRDALSFLEKIFVAVATFIDECWTLSTPNHNRRGPGQARSSPRRRWCGSTTGCRYVMDNDDYPSNRRESDGRTASVTSYHPRAKRHCDGLRPLICPKRARRLATEHMLCERQEPSRDSAPRQFHCCPMSLRCQRKRAEKAQID